MEENIYNREKLYHEIWDEPITIVAKKYKVSDVAIKKVCKKLNIPTPGRGYWQKVKAGAKFDKPPLPKYEGDPVSRIVNKGEYEKYRQEKETIKLKIEAERCEGGIKVSERLRNPHPLVSEANEQLKKIWAKSREKDPLYHLCENVLDIRISKSSAHRGLCIMDAVLKALYTEGYSVGFKKGWSHTYVTIENESIGFRLHERIKQVPHVKTEDEIRQEKRGRYVYTPPYDYIPTGILTLSIEYYQYLPR